MGAGARLLYSLLSDGHAMPASLIASTQGIAFFRHRVAAVASQAAGCPLDWRLGRANIDFTSWLTSCTFLLRLQKKQPT